MATRRAVPVLVMRAASRGPVYCSNPARMRKPILFLFGLLVHEQVKGQGPITQVQLMPFCDGISVQSIGLANWSGGMPMDMEKHCPHSSDMDPGVHLKCLSYNNDRDVILQTIGGVVPTNTRVRQLP